MVTRACQCWACELPPTCNAASASTALCCDPLVHGARIHRPAAHRPETAPVGPCDVCRKHCSATKRFRRAKTRPPPHLLLTSCTLHSTPILPPYHIAPRISRAAVTPISLPDEAPRRSAHTARPSTQTRLPHCERPPHLEADTSAFAASAQDTRRQRICGSAYSPLVATCSI
jgi:hypothetical protein